MAASKLTLNPYQPTWLDETRLPKSPDKKTSLRKTPLRKTQPLDLNPTASWIVSGVRRKLLYREIRLSGFLETTIIWDARGAYEFIRVGDRKVVEKFCWLSATHFEFQITTLQAVIDGKIDVDICCLLFTRKFRLTLNDQVIYQE